MVCSEEEDSCGGAFNGDVRSFRQTRLGFEFGLWFDRFRTLVEIGESTIFPHTLLEVCPSHKDKVEIKCMGSVGEKTPTEPKFYSFLSKLRHIEYDEVDVYVLCSIMSWVIRLED